MEAQTQFLKAQINPHFLFNHLNNIYSLVISKSEKAPKLILLLSDLLRYTLYKGNYQKVSVQEELEQIHNLVEIFKLKEDNPINVELKFEPIPNHCYIEPMILIPLVENCFKHWDLPRNENAFISIACRNQTNETHIDFYFSTVNSTKKEFIEGLTSEGGIGLENIKKRLQLVYGEAALLHYRKENQIFITELKIQCPKKFHA